MTPGYRIADEPAPGPLARFAVEPFWPLLTVMLGGAWIAWPWFAFNAIAVGSPTRRKEILWVLLGFAGSAVLGLGAFAGVVALGLAKERWALRAAFLVVLLWKLGVSYALNNLQARTIEIYRYFGGQLGNGAYVALPAYFLRAKLLDLIPADAWLLLVVLA